MYTIRKLYWYICRPTTYGVKVALINEGGIWLVKNTYGDSIWNLPGGGFRYGKETPKVAALREIKEELTTRGEIRLKKVYKYSQDTEYKKDTVTVFESIYRGDILVKSREIEEVRYFTFPETKELRAASSVRKYLRFKGIG